MGNKNIGGVSVGYTGSKWYALPIFVKGSLKMDDLNGNAMIGEGG